MGKRHADKRRARKARKQTAADMEAERAAYRLESERLARVRERHRLLSKTQALRAARGRLEKRVQAITASKPHPIYDSPRWRALRLDVLAAAGGRCCLCGRGARDGAVLHVDHIKPVSRFPALTWEPSNLQVLCADCNLGKSNRYTTDWR